MPFARETLQLRSHTFSGPLTHVGAAFFALSTAPLTSLFRPTVISKTLFSIDPSLHFNWKNINNMSQSFHYYYYC